MQLIQIQLRLMYKIIMEKISSKYKASIKVISTLIEIAIPVIFSALLLEYKEHLSSNRYIKFSFSSEGILYTVCSLFFLILISEWIRRFYKKNDRSTYRKYIYIIVMLLAFILSIFYLQLFITYPRN